MGKGKAKIEIKKIEDLQKRNICFTKRRQGLFKKAGDLCRQYPGTSVAALVFSPAGKPYIFGDPKALLGSDQEAEKGLDGNQIANLGDLDAVNINELPAGPNSKKRNRSDWESSHLGESDSEDYMNNPHIFGDPKALLGSDQEEEKGLDGNQFADLGDLDAVNINELPGGPNSKKRNRSDWESSHLGESDSEDYMNNPYIFRDLLAAEEKAIFLDGNQMSDLGNLDAVVNINKLPGAIEEKGDRSDWDFSQLVDLDESDSDYMNQSSSNEWDLSELASHYMIQSEEKCSDHANANHFVDLGELESMLMDDYLGNDFLGDVETYANQLLEL
ncbi:unnamed protein product [Cuscuta campestris]|uniref:MADS-box domain-containing protein n=1 Tax=Cuscuta campestris TaxID=132261 RepID=A0A484LL34_9ASTE|nr:unnamed protein product [Cuscuta campestris]